jgi:hypothetical protein
MNVEELYGALESVKRIELKPGDALLFRVSGFLSAQHHDELEKAILKRIPGWPILIVDDSLVDLSVARQLEADPA